MSYIQLVMWVRILCPCTNNECLLLFAINLSEDCISSLNFHESFLYLSERSISLIKHMILQVVPSVLRTENKGFISVLKENFECCISMLLKVVAIRELPEYTDAHLPFFFFFFCDHLKSKGGLLMGKQFEGRDKNKTDLI